MSTYVKAKMNLWIYKLLFKRILGFYLQSNIHVIVNGVVLDEISKTQNVKILLWCAFSLEAPYDDSLMSLEVQETRDEIHSFIHSFTSSFFFNI